MIHLKKKRAFALAVLTFVIICIMLPFTAIADTEDQTAINETVADETVAAQEEAGEVDEDEAANLAAIKLLSDSEGFDAEALSEDEAAEYLEAADTFIGNYSSNVSEEQEFTENLNKALAAKRSEIPAFATWISLLPPIIAIALALITKEVYSSLFLGILSGAVLYANFSLSGT
ncbi:MAG: hypothetical protein Q4D57_07100, partial [Clostridia bacterium]|nr:hypothetical protein [Clostridia bacterium]